MQGSTDSYLTPIQEIRKSNVMIRRRVDRNNKDMAVYTTKMNKVGQYPAVTGNYEQQWTPEAWH